MIKLIANKESEDKKFSTGVSKIGEITILSVRYKDQIWDIPLNDEYAQLISDVLEKTTGCRILL